MIEVDGLVAAVIPTPNASMSADAPEEFAAAMAVVDGEEGAPGVGPGAEQQTAAVDGDAVPGTATPSAAQPGNARPGAGESGSSLPGADESRAAESGADDASALGSGGSESSEKTPRPLVAAGPPGAEALLPVDLPLVAESQPPAGAGIDLSALLGKAPAPTEDLAPALPAPLVTDVGIDTAALDAPVVSVSSGTEETMASVPMAVADSASAPAALTGPLDAGVSTPILASPGTAVGDQSSVGGLAEADDVNLADRAAVTTAEGEAEILDPDAGVLNREVAAQPGSTADAVATRSSAGELANSVATTGRGPDLETPTTPTVAPTESVADVATPVSAAGSRPPVEPTNAAPPMATAPVPRADPGPTEVADVAPPPRTSTPAEATPTQQVAEALREVRRLADGSHRLSLQLHPEELGTVQLEVAIREGQLHVRAVAETEATRTALEHNLPELRSDLRDAGVRAGSLEVGPDASGRDRTDSPNRDTRTDGSPETATEEPQPAPPDPSTATGLDIRL